MREKFCLVTLAILVGLVGGFILNRLPTSQSAYAQDSVNIKNESEKVLVQGSGVANSSLRPPKDHMSRHFTLRYSPQNSFSIVPSGKRFVLTDIMLHDKGSVKQSIAINIARANPVAETGDIMLQIPIEPSEPEQVHLCSGYVIPSGHALVAWTNAGIEPGQIVNISVTGYLEDEPK